MKIFFKKWLLATSVALLASNISLLSMINPAVAEKVLEQAAPIVESVGDKLLSVGKVGAVLAATMAGNASAKDETPKTLTPNPNPNVKEHNGSLSLEIPLEIPQIDENPVIGAAFSQASSDRKLAATDTVTTSNKVVEKGKDKAAAAAANQATDVSQPKKDAPITLKVASTTELVTNVGDDPAVALIAKKRSDEKKQAAATSLAAQDFVQGGIDASLSQTRASVNRMHLDSRLVMLNKQHPDQFLAWINAELSRVYGVPENQLTNIVKKIHLLGNGDVEIEHAPAYIERLECIERQAQDDLFYKASRCISSDLGKIKEFVSTSSDLHRQLKHVDVSRSLVESAVFRFVGVDRFGRRVYRCELKNIYQKIVHLTGTSHASRSYAIDLIMDDTGKINSLVKFLDQVNDSELIKPKDQGNAPSTSDLNAAAGSSSGVAVTGAPMPPSDPEDPEDEKEGTEKKVKNVKIKVQDVSDDSIDDVFHKQRSHIFSPQHIENGIYEKFGPTGKNPMIDKVEEQVIQDSIKEAFRQIIKKSVVQRDLHEGWSRIQTSINGFDVEVRVFIKDGKLLNINAFVGHSARPVGEGGNPIIKVPPIVNRPLLAVAMLQGQPPETSTTTPSQQEIKPVVQEPPVNDVEQKITPTKLAQAISTPPVVQKTDPNVKIEPKTLTVAEQPKPVIKQELKQPVTAQPQHFERPLGVTDYYLAESQRAQELAHAAQLQQQNLLKLQSEARESEARASIAEQEKNAIFQSAISSKSMKERNRLKDFLAHSDVTRTPRTPQPERPPMPQGEAFARVVPTGETTPSAREQGEPQGGRAQTMQKLRERTLQKMHDRHAKPPTTPVQLPEAEMGGAKSHPVRMLPVAKQSQEDRDVRRINEMRAAEELRKVEALRRREELSKELAYRQAEDARRFQALQRAEAMRREQNFYRMQEFRRQEEFKRAQALLREEETRRAEEMRRAEEYRAAMEAEARRYNQMIAWQEYLYKRDLFDKEDNKEPFFIAINTKLHDDFNITKSKLYDELADLYEKKGLGDKQLLFNGASRFALLAKLAQDTIRDARTNYYWEKKVELEFLAIRAGASLWSIYDSSRKCEIETGFIMKKSLARWQSLRETLENPTQIGTKSFDVRSQNLKSYYHDRPSDLQNIVSFEKYTGSPFQINLHQAMVKLVGTVDEIFYKYKIYPMASNQSDDVERTTSAILNFLFMAKAFNDSNRFDEAVALIDLCTNLVKTEKAIASILDNHESRFWNALWFGESFAQRLHSCIGKSSESETKSVTDSIDASTQSLVSALQHNCQDSMQRRVLFLQQAQGIISLNTQRRYEQAGQQTVELITTNFEHAVAPGKEPQSKVAYIKTRLIEIIHSEQVQAEGPMRSGYTHLECFHPNTITFIKAIIKAHPEILAQQQKVLCEPVHELVSKDEAAAELADLLKVDSRQLSRPLHLYLRRAQSIDPNNRSAVRALVLLCDQINKKLVFAEAASENPQVIQIPGLYQLYDGLEISEGYGRHFGLFCGYYAAHAAKIFAANSHATQDQLIDLLNDRNGFDMQTLMPGQQVIKRRRGDHDGDIADLRGEEIGLLLPPEVLDKTIIVGNAAEDDALRNEDTLARATQLAERFINKQIEYLIYILPTNERNHWIPVLARRDRDQRVQLIITDSVGIDRRSMHELRHVYQALTASEYAVIDMPMHQYLDESKQVKSEKQIHSVGLRCEFDGCIEFAVSQETSDVLINKEDACRHENPAKLYDAKSIRDICIRTVPGDSGSCCFKLLTREWVWLYDDISICINLVPNRYSHGDIYFYNVFSRPLVFHLSVAEYDRLKPYLDGKPRKEVLEGEHSVGWDIELHPKECMKFPAHLITNLVLKIKTLS